MSVRSLTTRYRVKQRRAETSYRIENGSGRIDKLAGWSAYESICHARRSGGAGCNSLRLSPRRRRRGDHWNLLHELSEWRNGAENWGDNRLPTMYQVADNAQGVANIEKGEGD